MTSATGTWPAADTGDRRRSRWTVSPSLASIVFRPTIGGWPVWLVAAAVVTIGLLLAAALVYRTGGTQYAYPYLILLPVILAGAVFKAPGGLFAAAVAALLLGPHMPLDVEAGTMQTTRNWLVRLGMYLVIGGFAGILAMLLDRTHRRSLANERVDPTTGLLLPAAAGRLAASGDPAIRARYAGAHAVAIDFDVHQNVVSAMGIDLGNAVLRRIGATLATLDGEELLAARIHGATFGVLVPGGEAGVARYIEGWRGRTPRVIRIDGVPLTVLPRFGVAALSEEDRTAGEPFRKALVALRAAAEAGRKVIHFDEAHDTDSRDNLMLLSEFRADLEQGMCEVHFQPKLSLASRRVFGVEALIRWSSAKRGAVSPGRFVPLVESTMLIDGLTRFVIERAVVTLAEWRRHGHSIDIAVNISMRNLEDEDFVEFLEHLPAEHGVSARRIELEVTETALMRGLETARRALERLREAGYIIAIDDFGTGYSSFSYLKELPIDWVKLDQSFVRDLPDNSQSREISAATAAMCKRLGYKVIAEGVESAAALDYLKGQGYDAVQGYHLARPMPGDAIPAWLADLDRRNGR